MDHIKKLIRAHYRDYNLVSIVEDEDVFYFQIQPKDSSGTFFGGVKSIDKDTRKIEEVNPLRIKWLIGRLMTEGVQNA